MIVSLPKEKIDAIFEENSNPQIAILKLFQVAIQNWDELEEVGQFPQINKKTSLYIMEQIKKNSVVKMVELGLMTWMNQGFGCIKKGVKEWEIFIDEDKLVYKKKVKTYTQGTCNFVNHGDMVRYYKGQGYDYASTMQLFKEGNMKIGAPIGADPKMLKIDKDGRYILTIVE